RRAERTGGRLVLAWGLVGYWRSPADDQLCTPGETPNIQFVRASKISPRKPPIVHHGPSHQPPRARASSPPRTGTSSLVGDDDSITPPVTSAAIANGPNGPRAPNDASPASRRS